MTTTKTKLSLSDRARAWYDAAYRRWAASEQPEGVTRFAFFGCADDEALRGMARVMGDMGDTRAAIAARYARIAA